jgi:hypothetical protein
MLCLLLHLFKCLVRLCMALSVYRVRLCTYGNCLLTSSTPSVTRKERRRRQALTTRAAETDTRETDDEESYEDGRFDIQGVG